MQKLKHYELSFTGRRKTNQDSCLYYEFNGYQLLAVADGMGGYEGGELASSTAISVAKFTFEQEIVENEDPDLQKILRNIYQKADENIKQVVNENPSLESMGTTLSCVLIDPDMKYVYGNLGDSRIYLYDGKYFNQITQDHTYVQQYINEFGYPVPDEILNGSNVLLKAIDGKGDEPDIFPIEHESYLLNKGEVFLICSDGLIPEKDVDLGEHFKRYLVGSKSLQMTAEQIVAYSFHSGMHDNITIMLASYGKIKRKKENLQVFSFPPSDKNPEQILLASHDEPQLKKKNYNAVALFTLIALLFMSSIWFFREPFIDQYYKTKLDDEAQQMIDDANTQINDGMYLEAAFLMKNVLGNHPDNKFVHKRLKSTLKKAFEEEYESQSFDKVINLGKNFSSEIENNSKARFYYANSLSEEGLFKDVIDELVWFYDSDYEKYYDEEELIKQIAFTYGVNMQFEDAKNFFKTAYLNRQDQLYLDKYIQFTNSYYFNIVSHTITSYLMHLSNEDCLLIIENLKLLNTPPLNIVYQLYYNIRINQFKDSLIDKLQSVNNIIQSDVTDKNFESFMLVHQDTGQARFHHFEKYYKSPTLVIGFDITNEPQQDQFKDAVISAPSNSIQWYRLNTYIQELIYDNYLLLITQLINDHMANDRDFNDLKKFVEGVQSHELVQYIMLEIDAYDEIIGQKVTVNNILNITDRNEPNQLDEKKKQYVFTDGELFIDITKPIYIDGSRQGFLNIGLKEKLE